MSTLEDLTSILRSKNADPFVTTVDLFFKDEAGYARTKASGVLTPQSVAAIYGLPDSAVLGVFWIDNVHAAKVSFLKMNGGKYVASGDLDNIDTLGTQQHHPLRGIHVD